MTLLCRLLSTWPESNSPLRNVFLPFYKLDISRESLLEGLVITPSGDLKIVSALVIAKFKGFMSEMIKKISQSIAEGRGMIGVSLPIRIFEPRSTIDRITDAWGYAVHFLSGLDTAALPTL